ncbi:uncharacterized protein LOC114667215 [Erpetoichthys calabaricus]|uniref:uncharacterized protein LOC114667215 n=1 Tax=Erpetoichthys calabaricus TaxID=27687 RepID=UPI0010A0B49C|nr:uncharacterized protein LOC114667215 [Erpetoichthys calabaricus]
MALCSALFCPNSNLSSQGKQKTLLHRFPPCGSSLFLLWKGMVGRSLLPDNPRLCSLHFSSDQYITHWLSPENIPGLKKWKKRRRLKRNAVPSIFFDSDGDKYEMVPVTVKEETYDGEDDSLGLFATSVNIETSDSHASRISEVSKQRQEFPVVENSHLKRKQNQCSLVSNHIDENHSVSENMELSQISYQQNDCAVTAVPENEKEQKDYKSKMCNFCGLKFCYPSNLGSHLRIHKSLPLHCSFCKKYCRTHWILNRHLQKHEKLHLHTQNVDSKRSQIKQLVKTRRMQKDNIHRTILDGRQPITKRSKTRQDLQNSKTFSVLTTERSQSSLAFQSYEDAEIMDNESCQENDHRPGVLPNVAKDKVVGKNYLCNFCGLSFFYPHNLGSHLRIHHSQSLQCSHCREQCRTHWLLNKHLYKHRSGTSGLLSHVREESNQSILNKSSQSSSILGFRCKVCDKSFASKFWLGMHSQIHLPSWYKAQKSIHIRRKQVKSKPLKTDNPLPLTAILSGSLTVYSGMHVFNPFSLLPKRKSQQETLCVSSVSSDSQSESSKKFADAKRDLVSSKQENINPLSKTPKYSTTLDGNMSSMLKSVGQTSVASDHSFSNLNESTDPVLINCQNTVERTDEVLLSKEKLILLPTDSALLNSTGQIQTESNQTGFVKKAYIFQPLSEVRKSIVINRKNPEEQRKIPTVATKAFEERQDGILSLFSDLSKNVNLQSSNSGARPKKCNLSESLASENQKPPRKKSLGKPQCQQCGALFTRFYSLKRHLRSKHNSAKEGFSKSAKSFACQFNILWKEMHNIKSSPSPSYSKTLQTCKSTKKAAKRAKFHYSVPIGRISAEVAPKR